MPHRILSAVAALLIVVGIAAQHRDAAARPPENADTSLAPWFNSLRDPVNGVGCCSQADCRPVEYRLAAGHYEALIGRQFDVPKEHWEAVDPERILERTDNPTGRAIACWVPGIGVLCFIRPPDV